MLVVCGFIFNLSAAILTPPPLLSVSSIMYLFVFPILLLLTEGKGDKEMSGHLFTLSCNLIFT